MSELLNNIKVFLEGCDLDYSLDLLENKFQILQELQLIYDFTNNDLNEEEKCLLYTIDSILQLELVKLYKINDVTKKVIELKKLVLPDQRTFEWYEMRKNKLTASSFADALGKSHYNTRNESLLNKIVDKPFEANPITEWGVKYEEVATRFYEHLTGSKIYEFGLIPHPEFPAFGASPDGICDVNSPPEYIGRMLEIKCPPKRKFTKSVPPNYMMQMQGQLEVCKLNECDFFQVKLEEYDNFDDYKNDKNDKNGVKSDGFPKGYTITYSKENDHKFNYLYCPLFTSDENILLWKEEKISYLLENNLVFKEEKFWKITRYECTLVKRDQQWWLENVENIYEFYKDLLYYKKDNNLEILKNKVAGEKSKKPMYHVAEVIDDFCLISDEEDNNNN